MERKFSFVPGEYYHIYNRGIEKRSIFESDEDWKRFQHLLYLGNSDKNVIFKTIQGDPLDWKRGNTLVNILAYTLMPNHFHLIIKEKNEGGVSKFLTKVSTAYSMYFNTKYERSGGLFCRPFRAKHIGSDEYFQWVFSYVHFNALDVFDHGWKERGSIDFEPASEYLRAYKYSSYRDYFRGDRLETRILEKEAVPIELANIEDISTMFHEFQGDTLE